MTFKLHTLFVANKNSISLFQMIEDTLTQNSSSEFMVMFDNEPTKETCTQTESKESWEFK